MKKKAVVLSLALLLSAIAFASQTENLANAGSPTVAYELPITVKILSPKDGTNFYVDHFLLNLGVTDIPQDKLNFSQNSFTFNVRVILDGHWSDPHSVDIPSKSPSFNHSINVTGLSNGSHSLKVSVYCNIYSDGSLTVLLGLSETISITKNGEVDGPAIYVVSPENKTYDSNNVSLAFSVDETVIWTGYSLDGRENVTVSGNTTISGLPNGLHSLVVFANGTFGNTGASETISFTVSVPEPFPTLVVAVTVAVVAVVAVFAGLLVYLKKRRSLKS